MNKDQIKGSVKEVVGKAQEQIGAITGSTEQRAKGLVKQTKGRTQKSVGKVKDILKHYVNKA